MKVVRSITELNKFCKEHGKSIIVKKDRRTGLILLKGFRGGDYNYKDSRKVKRSKKKVFKKINTRKLAKGKRILVGGK